MKQQPLDDLSAYSWTQSTLEKYRALMKKLRVINPELAISYDTWFMTFSSLRSAKNAIESLHDWILRNDSSQVPEVLPRLLLQWARASELSLLAEERYPDGLPKGQNWPGIGDTSTVFKRSQEHVAFQEGQILEFLRQYPTYAREATDNWIAKYMQDWREEMRVSHEILIYTYGQDEDWLEGVYSGRNLMEYMKVAVLVIRELTKNVLLSDLITWNDFIKLLEDTDPHFKEIVALEKKAGRGDLYLEDYAPPYFYWRH